MSYIRFLLVAFLQVFTRVLSLIVVPQPWLKRVSLSDSCDRGTKTRFWGLFCVPFVYTSMSSSIFYPLSRSHVVFYEDEIGHFVWSLWILDIPFINPLNMIKSWACLGAAFLYVSIQTLPCVQPIDLGASLAFALSKYSFGVFSRAS